MVAIEVGFFLFPFKHCYRLMHAQSLSHVQLCAILWNVTHQDPLSMEFSRHEYSSGLPFPTTGDLPSPEMELSFPAPPALIDSLPISHPGSPWTHEFLFI